MSHNAPLQQLWGRPRESPARRACRRSNEKMVVRVDIAQFSRQARQHRAHAGKGETMREVAKRMVTVGGLHRMWLAPLVFVATSAAAACSSSHGGGNGDMTGDGGTPGVSPTCSPLADVLQGDSTIPSNSPPLVRRLWRLSSQQWGNAVRDLLGLSQAPVLTSTGGTSDYAFFSDDSVMVDANFQFAVYQAAETVMTQIAPQIPTLAACNAGEAPDACAQRFAQNFGAQAFRRPLDPSEVTALLATYSVGTQQDFNTGIGMMIEALLISPSFLHRSELGPSTLTADANGKFPDTTLTPYEVATQLSFLFEDTTPDATLMAAAASGALGTPDGVSAQVDRLLGLDPVRQNINRIISEWFNVSQLFSKTKDPSYFAALATADQDQTVLENDVYASAIQFINEIAWGPSGKVNDLLTSQHVFVNSRLGLLYGLSTGGTPDQFMAVTDSNRSGLVTQPAFLWAMSDPADTSIVKRGKFIHDDVLCVDPGPGPGNILSDPAVQAKLATLPTEIEKSDYRLSTQPCMTCHSQLDPYARVLENFGAIGDYRTVADGVPVDPTGNFSPPSPLPAGPIKGPSAFAQAIVSAKLLNACAVQKMMSYTLGRMIRTQDTCEVEQLHAAFEQTDGSVPNLFRKVALANFMRARSGGTQ